MKSKFLSLIIVVFCSISATYSEQEFIFRHLDLIDGLSDNQIRNFTQTPDGRIAIRLVSNLNIYNGATFEHFYYDRGKDYKWTFNRYQIFKEYCDADGRLWMKAPGYLSLFDLKTNRFIYNIEDELKLLGISRKLKNMFIDENKNFWFLTEDNAFSFYDITKKKLLVVEKTNVSFTEKYGYPEEIAQYKNLYWIVYSGGLIRCWDSASGEFIHQDTNFTGKISEITNRLSIKVTVTGDLWLMYNNAVCFYNHTDKIWKEVVTITGASNFFTSMDLDKDANVWVGASWSGMRRIDGRSHEVKNIPRLELTTGGTLDNDIQCVFVDNNNGLWIGTLWQGICYYNPAMYKFKLIQSVQNGSRTTNESIRCLLEYDDDNILIGTTHHGLLQYNPVSDKIENAFGGLLSDDLILSLYRDKENRLWVGTYLNGFYCFDGKNIKTYNRSIKNLELFPNQNISRAIYEDPAGRFWVSVDNEGVGELNLNTGEITMLKEKHPEIAFHQVDFDFYPVDGHTFAVYGESGIYYYDTHKNKTFIPEKEDPDNPKFMHTGIKYYCVFKDSRNLEWFGTERGLRIWDEKRKKAYTINTESGLPSNSVSSVEEDNNGIYWVSSLNGISKIELSENADGYTFSLVNFDSQDGLQSGKFYDRASLKTQNGYLYFGGHHGINSFNPNDIHYNQNKTKPVFTALRLFNSLIKENTKYNRHVILNHPINNTPEIRLNYNENFITFEFAGLNYVNESHTYYRYKLENYDQDWTEVLTSGLGSATYTGLRPGKYKLIVYTANNDKVWGDKAAGMNIVISPPWWANIYTESVYFLLLVTFLYFLYKYFAEKQKIKIEQQRKFEQEKQKEELDQLKFRFFTNISHEFRTPLSLIISPVEALLKQDIKTLHAASLQQKLVKIHKNAKDLLNLVNQLLDFRKLEMKGEELHLSYGDLVEFTDVAFQQFKEISINEQIDFSLNIKEEHLYMQFDKDKVHKILNNLLSNAFKYTPNNGQVVLSLGKTTANGREYAVIKVADSGVGIPHEKISKIFDRFYQSDNQENSGAGSGIGLHLVKEYVGLHEGKITAESVLHKGTTLTVWLPADLKTEVPAIETENVLSLPVNPPTKTHSKKSILIVEDNPDFCQFLVEQLETDYRIFQATNGEEGEQQALKEFPDLIITDIMMPKIDGIELCRRIKTNIRISHIPVILLTARISDESKLTGYEAGADEYISKPFNFDILLLRIQKLIAQQESRKEQFRKTVEVTPSSITITSLDEQLIQNALLCIEKNINNTEYSINELSNNIGMSVRNLYRKIQSITGLSPADFIRSIRLKRAAQLLRDTQLNVSEIADMVGFNTIKYFNKHFKEEFGLSPTQYRQQN
ncbi:MAG: response regulator [Dysgonamonadaceae bacterium]|jgi:signal transduction histidine kinase/DNA-binding response OmpR family regulator/ligand-binding sensor domain-containing protein|nr:response regulator [Dysgonamonadaceae bacterium]